ncbi:zinc-finger domain-containing protein [Rhodospirillaceae bacterium SYSU D60014]|uniref:zinc-finger domain-containing protein n=1 Tax=Virgifigura deserti TaxID=2268457 RepID=UPI000E66579D
MEPVETLHVDTEVVGCDGGGGALGHPLVYLNIGKERRIDCPYCGRRFILDRPASVASGH